MNTIPAPKPILPVAPEIEEDVIELTISEVDRQTAGEYSDNNNCLICTSLRNNGHNVVSVAPQHVRLSTLDDIWLFENPSAGSGRGLCSILGKQTAPFYGPSVVGKVIRLRKVKLNEG